MPEARSRKSDPFGWIGASIDGRFRVEAVAGEGAFGLVYRGRHLGFDEPIAIKCLKLPASLQEDERASFYTTFHDEARLLLRLSRRTTGIVQALDVGAATSPAGAWTPYIVMEWLEGDTLEADLGRRAADATRPRSLVETLDLLGPAAAAIAIAHGEGVSHRDVKPANLFLADEGAGRAIKVLDFGIAKVLEDATGLTTALARTGASVRAFTPQYGAPEQFSPNYGATGPWTDVFAMALVLIEVASGRAALVGKDPIQLYVAACDEKRRPSLAARGVQANARVEEVLRRALEVDPARRYRTLGEMWADLVDARSTQTTATQPSEPSGRLPPPPRVPDGSPARASTTAPTPSVGVPAAADENRLCTIVFADLSGFTSLSERLDPEAVKEIIDECFHAFTECIERMGGWVDKFVGDGVMAVFGVPRATDNDAERAVHAALQMQSALVEISSKRRALRRQRFTMRIGINSGRVFAGTVGGATRRDFTVIGDAVNVAARLQQHAPEGSIVIGRDTYRQVVELFDVEALAPIEAKGKTEPLAAYRVIGPASAKRDVPPSDFYGLETRFVGRAVEMQRALETLDNTIAEPRAQLLTLVGAPGTGRSRMLSELATSLTLRRQFVFAMAAQSSPLGQGSSYRLVASLLRMRFRIHEDDPPELLEQKLRRAVRWIRALKSGGGDIADDTVPPWARLVTDDARAEGSIPPPSGDFAGRSAAATGLDEVLPEVATLLGAQSTAVPIDDSIAPDERWSAAKNRVAAAVARLLGAVASRCPVVLLCDDLHWADDASIDLLDDLVLRLADAPVLVVCTARPELYDRRPHWGEGKPAHVRVDVGPLARRHVEEMARDRLRSVPEPVPDLVRVLADRAEGNPLTLEESLHLLIEAAVVERKADGAWAFHAERLHTLALPATIQGIVQARLDRLEPEARALLAYASVIGRTFWQGAVEFLRRAPAGTAGQPGGSLAPDPLLDAPPTPDLLSHLRERQLVRARDVSTFPSDREFVFAESATQEVAYDTLSAKVRRRLHRRAAAWLVDRAHGDAGAALVAMHHDRGGDVVRAVLEYTRAAVHAAGLGQNAEALRHFERVREIHDQSEAGADDLPSADRTVEDPEESRVASWRERTRLRLDLGDVLRRIGRLEEAEARYEEARARIVRAERRTGETFDVLEPLRWEARVDFRLALTHRVRGAVEPARELCERAIAGAMQGRAPDETPPMWAVLAALHRRRGDLDACKAAALSGLRVCRGVKLREGRWRESVSHLLGALGAVFYSRQQLVRAERCFRQALRVVDEKANPEAASIAMNTLAAALFARGDLVGARKTFLASLSLKEREGNLHELVIAHNNLAEVELGLGEPGSALAQAQRAVRLAEQIQAAADLADCYRNLADASLASGDRPGALEACTRALAMSLTGGGRVYLPDVAVGAARICEAILSSEEPGAPLHDAALATARRVMSSLEHLDGGRAERCRAALGRFLGSSAASGA